MKVTPEGVQAIVTLANGDMRKSLNILQVSITQVAIIFPVFFCFQKDKLNRVDFERSSLFRVCSDWHIHVLLALLFKANLVILKADNNVLDFQKIFRFPKKKNFLKDFYGSHEDKHLKTFIFCTYM